MFIAEYPIIVRRAVLNEPNTMMLLDTYGELLFESSLAIL